MSPAGRPGTFTAGWRDGAYRRRPRAAELTAGARPLPARWPGAGAISCSDAGEDRCQRRRCRRCRDALSAGRSFPAGASKMYQVQRHNGPTCYQAARFCASNVTSTAFSNQTNYISARDVPAPAPSSPAGTFLAQTGTAPTDARLLAAARALALCPTCPRSQGEPQRRARSRLDASAPSVAGGGPATGSAVKREQAEGEATSTPSRSHERRPKLRSKAR
jgi:hypothetical protein